MIDAQAAWDDLAEVIGRRDGWGSRALLAEMRRLESKHRVSEGTLMRFVRIFGDRFSVSVNEAEPVPAGELGVEPLVAEAGAAPPQVRGAHDGSTNGRTGGS